MIKCLVSGSEPSSQTSQVEVKSDDKMLPILKIADVRLFYREVATYEQQEVLKNFWSYYRAGVPMDNNPLALFVSLMLWNKKND